MRGILTEESEYRSSDIYVESAVKIPILKAVPIGIRIHVDG